MRFTSIVEVLLTSATLLGVTSANPLPDELDVALRRALSNSPSGGYAPEQVSCPSTSLTRNAKDISNGEKEFIKKRHDTTDKALADFFRRANMSDFDVDGFLAGYSPVVSLAFSGGGYRAMLSGAGAVKAMDSRTPNSTGPNQIGGLLQSASYFSGLSGGSWLLGSIFVNNFTTIGDLQASSNLWDLTNSVLAPYGSGHILDTLKYYRDLRREVTSKEDAGFDVTLTDYWGRALSRQFVNGIGGGPAVTWSSIALTDQYKNAEFPFPLVVADGRGQGETIISSNATVYEFNPLEFGSFDPSLFAFTPTEYIGSSLTGGAPSKKDVCFRGFDNAGFIMGTSSSLFNQFLLQVNSLKVAAPIRRLLKSILSDLSNDDSDVADYTPNPFFGVNPRNNPSAKTRNLTLVDGGEDLQNIPLHPLIQPPRKVDVIFAFDNSADTVYPNGTLQNWPNGTALVATYERSLNSSIANGTLFPSIPDQNTFVNLGLNTRPTFFGCNGSNITTDTNKVPPLVVYIPNTPWTFNSNVATFQLDYSDGERDRVIENGFNIATQGNGTTGVNGWPTCIACAIVYRQIERTGGSVTSQCQQCFQDYCWNGTVASRTPPVFNPSLRVKGKGNPSLAATTSVSTAVVVVSVIVGLMGLM